MARGPVPLNGAGSQPPNRVSRQARSPPGATRCATRRSQCALIRVPASRSAEIGKRRNERSGKSAKRELAKRRTQCSAGCCRVRLVGKATNGRRNYEKLCFWSDMNKIRTMLGAPFAPSDKWAGLRVNHRRVRSVPRRSRRQQCRENQRRQTKGGRLLLPRRSTPFRGDPSRRAS